jgi:hypothetical protein
VIANGENFREVGLHQCPSERKVERGPVRSPNVPSHVPNHLQNAAKVRGFSPTAPGFSAETDWPLEEGGFELVVPLCLGIDIVIGDSSFVPREFGLARQAYGAIAW